MPTVRSFNSDAVDFSERLIESGAVLHLPGVPLVQVLVARIYWAEPGVALLFPAFGQGASDTAILTYSELQVRAVGVVFHDKGEVRGLLTSIENARVDDKEDYRVGWQIWSEVAPLRHDVIDFAFASVARDYGLADRHPGVLATSL